jgi:hypothetical protein
MKNCKQDGQSLIPEPVRSAEPPARIIFEDFMVSPWLTGLVLPVTGGWGYTREDACVITKDTPDCMLAELCRLKKEPDADPRILERLENIDAQYESFRRDSFAPFPGTFIEKMFVTARIYEETLVFRDFGNRFWFILWSMLRQSLCEIDGKHFDCLAYEISLRHEDGRDVSFEREFWFDISSFYGNQGIFFGHDLGFCFPVRRLRTAIGEVEWNKMLENGRLADKPMLECLYSTRCKDRRYPLKANESVTVVPPSPNT